MEQEQQQQSKINDEYYMKLALAEGAAAGELLEVPIGCVIVYKDKVIGRGKNLRNTKKSTLCHAEILAIEEATQWMGDWRLEGCTLYVTVEPCPMCAGAIIQARIPRVVYGTKNAKAGCAGSVLNILQEPGFNHQAEVVSGVLEEECAAQMTGFFAQFRQWKKKEKEEQKKE